MAEAANHTSLISHVEFTLLGFPGFYAFRRLLFIPFFLIYIITLSTNGVLIHIVRTESSLNSPMYILIAALSAINICGTSTVVPKMLLGFLMDFNRISLVGCLVQMFFIYFIIMMDCNVLLMMALDRYVAICMPLHYTNIMNRRVMITLVVAAVFRSVSFVSPVIYLASKVRFCGSDTIRHFACEHMALLSLVCGNISKNKIVGLSLRVTSMVFDLSFISASYGSITRAALKISTGAVRHKSLHTCATHLLVILVVYFFRLSSSIVYRISRSIPQDTHNLLSSIYLLFPAMVNPLIYGLRTKEIRTRFLKSLGRPGVAVGRMKPVTVSSGVGGL
ncbi:olfactory receptor 52K1-like [Spea bombifrons]|uniref:olfactory receptor 52K1-like n=1 Tax=Spea bombifrons TaxID=233779 RepID=UPI0023497819|nr:olfactory receptor 52K1-like [Spea bombifrons]